MAAKKVSPLPPFDSERMVARLVDLARVATGQKKAADFPLWTRRAWRLFLEQAFPSEFRNAVDSDSEVFKEAAFLGLCIATDVPMPTDGLKQMLPPDAFPTGPYANADELAAAISSKEAFSTPPVRDAIFSRLFSKDKAERLSFARGYVLGNSLPDLFKDPANSSRTTATGIYCAMLLYWPEITEGPNLPTVFRRLEMLYGDKKNLLGGWETFKKRAHRIGLRFGESASKR